MDGETVTNGIWTFLNSGVGFAIIWAAVVGLFFFLASRFNPFQDKWRAWEGSIITGIRLAEKQIPDDTPNAGLARLDAALRFVLDAYAEANGGKKPSDALTEQLRQAIQIKHNELDQLGSLGKPASKEAA
jgi:hypothetical protein